ncbi:NTF2 and RRM domain-containing protein [Diaporthe helianthi]|uniref:NTF2 and RRM domain-containing protein n=1 Tax=Diaporthe helianthi TaxID=158607 RepID=A0A2P5HSI4_DIAHE|nr:NTF2 and RRM domain-containing protein [Diaporthe helianthi]
MATNGNTNHQEQWRESGGAPSDAPSNPNTAADSTPSKDEVGWYFVQQYYTTLSKNPDKLHLFYNKRSQFVQGLEAELSPVAVGRQAISERIKELDFHDCKVRVSNVDSQASYDNIVIQVIGEICNKSGEPKKFVQTFVLAQQPAGYFLLNDILRYVNEGEEEATEAAVSEEAPAVEMEAPLQESAAAADSAPAAAATPEPEKVQTEQPSEPAPATLDAEVIDKKLEEASPTAKDTPSTTAAENPVEAAPAVEEAPKAEEAQTGADPEKAAQEIAEEEAKKPEHPKEPSPTPAPARAAPSPEPEKPKGPPKPMSWASRAAAAVGVPVKPVVPLPKAAPAAAPAQPKTAPAPAQPKAAAASAQASENTAQSADKDSEWRTAGADSKRQSRQQNTSTPPAEKEGTLAYVKFVTEKVKDDDLRSALGGFGEMVYFDINRSKNCAFVEYSAAAGYQAAIGASPITVNGENIVVEPRRPKAGAYGGANYNQNRGSISGRGRGFEGQRSGSQGGGRGGYPSRGRGGAPRGRGGPQATNA